MCLKPFLSTQTMLFGLHQNGPETDQPALLVVEFTLTNHMHLSLMCGEARWGRAYLGANMWIFCGTPKCWAISNSTLILNNCRTSDDLLMCSHVGFLLNLLVKQQWTYSSPLTSLIFFMISMTLLLKVFAISSGFELHCTW